MYSNGCAVPVTIYGCLWLNIQFLDPQAVSHAAFTCHIQLCITVWGLLREIL